MRNLKQSIAANIMVLMVDSADHVTGKAGLTLTLTASKNGAAFASIVPVVTERGDGWYSLALTTAHTDALGDLALHITSANADPTDILCRVVGYDPTTAWVGAGGEMALTGTALDAILALDPVVEGTLTMRQVHRILLARQAGITDGAGTGTLVFKSQDGAKARLTYTINPTTGERSYVLLDVS